MKFNFATMQPRHEINGVLLNAKSITIDGHCGEVDVSVEGGHVKISTILQALPGNWVAINEPEKFTYVGTPQNFKEQVIKPKKRGRKKA